jgi:DNA-binding Lrp family transcriptional regulator
MSIDDFDRAILDALQRDGSLTNAALAERVNLSPSQCSRRLTALEAAGYIQGYTAKLSEKKLGFGLRAITRVSLSAHGQRHSEAFAAFLARFDQVQMAFSVSGDADYVLMICVRDLAEFADFIHAHLLPNAEVQQVRSEIVLMTLKENQGIAVMS